jgi:hypothetical protein
MAQNQRPGYRPASSAFDVRRKVRLAPKPEADSGLLHRALADRLGRRATPGLFFAVMAASFASAFAFATSSGRFAAAGVTFSVGSGVAHFGTIGIPVALTSLAFLVLPA